MRIVIIGNGISGITASRWIRKLSDHEIVVISSETKYFYSRTALMYIYMGHMRFEDTQPYEAFFWDKNRIQLVEDHVDKIDFDNQKLALRKGESLAYDRLILAVGSRSNKFGWKGQNLKGVSGLYHIQDLLQMEHYSDGLERAVVVGGGLIGIEMAEMFHSRDIPVTMLVRESSYWNNVLPPEESAMVTRHIQSHHIDLRLNSNLAEIHDNGNGEASAVTIKETGEKIPCGYVGLTPGVSPNVEWLQDTDLHINKGIVVNEKLETSIPHVYAIGDCAEMATPRKGRRPIEAVWYTGRMMGETVAYNICGHEVEYDPGIWFNSAKFIDIEYQVYGHVPNQLADDQDSVYWEHEDGDKSIRLVYDKSDNTLLGFNLMGVRFRHEVCEKWIKEKYKIETVIQNLQLAYFDPEFYPIYSAAIAKEYAKKTGKEIHVKSKKGLNRVLAFLKK